MLGLAEGLRTGLAARAQWAAEDDAAARRAWQDELMAQQRAQWARENMRQGAVDSAWREYDDLSANGVVDASATGLSAPSARMLSAGNTGYGAGDAAIRETAGDFAREAQRLGMPAQHNPQGAISRRAATEVDQERGLGRIAAASKDAAGVRQSRATEKALVTDEGRRAEFKRLNSMTNEELVGLYAKQNADGNFPGMIDFDPKTGSFMFVSRIEGVPSQSLSRDELIAHSMGLWETGNGDYAKGAQTLLETARNKRGLDDSNFNRSSALAKGKADVYFKKREADTGDARLEAQKSHWKALEGIASRNAAARAPEIPADLLKKMSDVEQKYIQADPKDRPALERQYQMLISQAGVALRKPMGLPNARKGTELTPAEAMKARADLRAAGYEPEEIEQLVTGADPYAVIADRLSAMRNPQGQPTGKPTAASRVKPGPTPWDRAEAAGLRRPVTLEDIHQRLSPNYIYTPLTGR